MNKRYVAVIASAAAIGAGAQTAQPTRPDLSRATPVASPNRTLFSSLTAPTRGGGGGTPNTSSSAVSVVDSAGRNVGRLLGEWEVLLPYNGQLMRSFLNYQLDANRNLVFSGAMDWNTGNYGALYTTSDCSGTAWGGGYSAGVRYTGTPVVDQTGKYMLITDNTTGTVQTIVSEFYYDGSTMQCYLFSSPWTGTVFPIVATTPLSNFGTSPLMLK